MTLRVPHPLWILSAAILLVLVPVGLRFCFPAYQQWSAINQIQQYGFIDDVRRVEPEWLRTFVGESRMNAFDEIESIHFNSDIERHMRIYFAWFGPTSPVIDDAAFASVRSLPNLKRLDLSCTNVTDTGMEHVFYLQRLDSLDISGTDVADTSVPLLKRLSSLKKLSLRGTLVTDVGIAELKLALPGLEVIR